MAAETVYAYIESGSKQYRVEKNQHIDVELLGLDPELPVEFTPLLVKDGDKTHMGSPLLSTYRVIGKQIGEIKGEKVVNFKYKRRKNVRKKVGHRQRYTRVLITDIVLK